MPYPTAAKSLAIIVLTAAIAAAPACRKAPPPAAPGIDLPGMDTSVAPGDDFNAYANGGWSKATPIPADKSSYGIGEILVDETRKRTLSLIEEAEKTGPGASPDSRKIGGFYSSFMDEATIESKGIAPLKPEFDAISAISGRHALARALGARLRADVDPLNNTNFQTGNLFGVWVTQGLTDPSHAYPYLLQGGLGMPDRDYYLSATPHMAELRKQYQSHIESVFQLAGFPDPPARARRVFSLESKIAAAHATRVQSEDVHRVVSWKRRNSPSKLPGSTGRRSSTLPDLRTHPSSSSGTPKRSPDYPPWPRRSLSNPGRTGLSSMPSKGPPPSCPRPSSPNASASIRRLSTESPNCARAGSAAWT